MKVQTYLMFDGRCEEALEFYKKALGVSVGMVMRFKDSPDPASCPPGAENKIMHAAFDVGDTTVMASDGYCRGQTNFQGFSLALSVKDEAAADKAFAALGDGGKVEMPLAQTFFSKRFGIVSDRFGVSWMVLVE